MSLITELRRRNVHRTAVAYLAASWLFVQVLETLLPIFELADGILRYSVIILAIGFIPALAVSWAYEWTPEGMQRDQHSAVKSDAVVAHTRTWDRIIVVVLALAVGLFAFDRFVLSPGREAALIEAATEAGAEMERARVPDVLYESVAVLPFTNMSADPANEYFSDGLTETLLHMLAQLDDLRVAARTSSFAFKDKNEDIREIASELGVAHILEGSVQKAADRIRVTAQLIRADDGFHVWSENYDRTLDDVFAIQDEIAADVANALGSTLLADNEDIVSPFTNDVDAYDIYLKALEQQAINSFDALSRAETLLNESLAADPSFVDAKLALVRNVFLKYYTGTGEFEGNSVLSSQLLAEVLAEHPQNLEARQYDLRLRGVLAAREMDMVLYRGLMDELALTFDEGYGDPFVRADVANYLAGEDRTDEALRLLQEALVTDPLNVPMLMSQAGLLWRINGIDSAEQPMQTALSVQPDNPMVLWYLGILEINRHDIVKGMHYLRRTEIADPLDPAPTGELAITFTELGLYDHADRWLEEYRTRAIDRRNVISLEVQMAAERNDEETLRRIVPGAIDAFFVGEIEGDVPRVLLNEYAVMKLADGEPQEGIDYIESFYPGISSFNPEAVAGWNETAVLNRAVAPLVRAVSDVDTNRGNTEKFIAMLRDRGIEIGEDAPGFVRMQLELDGFQAAKNAFFSIFVREDFYILASQWHHFKRAPWATELRADPDVQAAMAEREERIALIREEVLEMMKEPIWQE